MKYFIVSDIHACYTKLIRALKKSGFDKNNPNHIFVFGGDALDRGKEGEKLIRYLERLIAEERIIGVLGNHDKFLLDFLSGDFSRVKYNIVNNGFLNTIRLGTKSSNFNLSTNDLNVARQNIIDKYPNFIVWLEKLPIYLEFSHHMLVHGFLDFSLEDWHNTEKNYAIWERGYSQKVPEDFEKQIIIGHTPNLSITGKTQIIYSDKKIMIDGGAVYGGKINVLILNENEI